MGVTGHRWFFGTLFAIINFERGCWLKGSTQLLQAALRALTEVMQTVDRNNLSEDVP